MNGQYQYQIYNDVLIIKHFQNNYEIAGLLPSYSHREASCMGKLREHGQPRSSAIGLSFSRGSLTGMKMHEERKRFLTYIDEKEYIYVSSY